MSVKDEKANDLISLIGIIFSQQAHVMILFVIDLL